MCLVSEYVVHKDYDIKLTKADLTTNGIQFTCFTGTKVQMLTPEELQSTASTSSKCFRRGAAGLPGEGGRDGGGGAGEGGSGGRVRGCTSTKVQILTPEDRRGFARCAQCTCFNGTKVQILTLEEFFFFGVPAGFTGGRWERMGRGS